MDNGYLAHLKGLKPQAFHMVLSHPKKAKQIAKKLIAPLNANIQFGMLPKYQKTTAVNSMSAGQVQLPDTWDWRNVYPNDDTDIKNKKKLITTPPNQALCGSCWAISSAGAVSDNFVVSGKTDYNPDLSTTYSLRCYPENQCAGGNPAQLLSDISKKGLASNNCVDYSWCLENGDCSGKATGHFNSDPQHLNTLIPTPCGCYDPSGKKLYKISQPQQINIDIDSDVVNTVKYHIYNHGPVVGGYHVFDNFMGGDFSKTDGIYLDTVDYSSKNNYYLTKPASWMGDHAVVIVGWGVSEKDIRYMDGDDEKTGKIPYWYVRNSWDTTWGDKGFFKIAMYPYNTTAQFEKIVPVQNSLTGGIVLFTAEDVIDNTDLGKINDNPPSPQKKYKSGDGSGNGSGNGNGSGSGNEMFWIGIGIGIFILLVIGVIALLMYNRKDTKTKKKGKKKK